MATTIGSLGQVLLDQHGDGTIDFRVTHPQNTVDPPEYQWLHQYTIDVGVNLGGLTLDVPPPNLKVPALGIIGSTTRYFNGPFPVVFSADHYPPNFPLHPSDTDTSRTKTEERDGVWVGFRRRHRLQHVVWDWEVVYAKPDKRRPNKLHYKAYPFNILLQPLQKKAALNYSRAKTHDIIWLSHMAVLTAAQRYSQVSEEIEAWKMSKDVDGPMHALERDYLLLDYGVGLV